MEQMDYNIKERKQTPLPTKKIISASFVQICEALNVNILFPFVAFMVEDLGYGGDQLGYYVGGLAASFCGAQFCSSILWGLFSDTYGRKPAIILGTFGTAIGMIIFGLSKTYTQAVLGRVIGGFLSGNLVVVKSYLAEITDDSNRGKAFSMMSVAWSLGVILAPLLGGFLSKPASKYPNVFPDEGFLARFPYSLPCFLCAMCNLLTAFLCYATMEETKNTQQQYNDSDLYLEDPSKLYTSSFDLIESPVSVIELGHQGKDAEEALSSNQLELSPSQISAKTKEFHLNSSLGVTCEKEKILKKSTQGTAMKVVGPSMKELNCQRGHGVGLFSNALAYEAIPQVEDQKENDRDVERGSSTSSGTASMSSDEIRIDDLEMVDWNRDKWEDINADKDKNHEDLISQISFWGYMYSCLSSQKCIEQMTRFTGWFRDKQSFYSLKSTRLSKEEEAMKRKSPSLRDILLDKNVLIVTSNYGLVAMGFILLDETIPLMLKLDEDRGGFSFNSTEIGLLLAITGAAILLFTYFILPYIANRSKLWMFEIGIIGALPVVFGYPALQYINVYLLRQISDPILKEGMKWALLILLSVLESTMSCMSFTSIMILINHSVTEEYLGAANGLGQSLASLARAIGPASGGILWSLSLKYKFIFFNFIATAGILTLCIILNRSLPSSMDFKKKKYFEMDSIE